MPDYVIRMAGETYKPEWYANVNPLVVVLCVVAVTQLVRQWRPELSIAVAMGLIPFSALCMAMSHAFHGNIQIAGLSVHPITLMMVIGIAIQGFAECFLSPKYLEYASHQAPPGREGLYLGYAHMNTFFAWLFGFIVAGYLLRAFVPDPSKLPPAVQQQHTLWLQGQAPMPDAYMHAHYLWYAFAGVGALSFLLLLVYIYVTSRTAAVRRVPAEQTAS
jgi:dipeptide/tripeptide permease